jgi:hypothetical protein
MKAATASRRKAAVLWPKNAAARLTRRRSAAVRRNQRRAHGIAAATGESALALARPFSQKSGASAGAAAMGVRARTASTRARAATRSMRDAERLAVSALTNSSITPRSFFLCASAFCTDALMLAILAQSPRMSRIFADNSRRICCVIRGYFAKICAKFLPAAARTRPPLLM